eukprot:163297_1
MCHIYYFNKTSWILIDSILPDNNIINITYLLPDSANDNAKGIVLSVESETVDIITTTVTSLVTASQKTMPIRTKQTTKHYEGWCYLPWLSIDGKPNDKHLKNYILVQISKTWHEAQYYCQKAYNSNLATIKTNKDLLIAESLRNSVKDIIDLWIGLRNKHKYGNWSWIDGSSCDYVETGLCKDDKHWNAEEPTNYNNMEYCSKIANNRFFDVDCNTKHFFLCNSNYVPETKANAICVTGTLVDYSNEKYSNDISVRNGTFVVPFHYAFNTNDYVKDWYIWNHDEEQLQINMIAIDCQQVCVTGNYLQWLDGVYIWSHFNQTSNSSVYHCKSCGDVYLYGLTDGNKYRWMIGTDFNIDGGWVGCNLGYNLGPNYLFDLESCIGRWSVWFNEKWTAHRDIIVETCDGFADHYVTNINTQNNIDTFNYKWTITSAAFIEAILNAKPSDKFSMYKFKSDQLQWHIYSYPNGRNNEEIGSFMLYVQLEKLPEYINSLWIKLQMEVTQINCTYSSHLVYYEDYVGFGLPVNKCLFEELTALNPSYLSFSANITMLQIIERQSDANNYTFVTNAAYVLVTSSAKKHLNGVYTAYSYQPKLGIIYHCTECEKYLFGSLNEGQFDWYIADHYKDDGIYSFTFVGYYIDADYEMSSQSLISKNWMSWIDGKWQYDENMTVIEWYFNQSSDTKLHHNYIRHSNGSKMIYDFQMRTFKIVEDDSGIGWYFKILHFIFFLLNIIFSLMELNPNYQLLSILFSVACSFVAFFITLDIYDSTILDMLIRNSFLLHALKYQGIVFSKIFDKYFKHLIRKQYSNCISLSRQQQKMATICGFVREGLTHLKNKQIYYFKYLDDFHVIDMILPFCDTVHEFRHLQFRAKFVLSEWKLHYSRFNIFHYVLYGIFYLSTKLFGNIINLENAILIKYVWFILTCFDIYASIIYHKSRHIWKRNS